MLTEGFGEGFSSPLILVVEDTSGIQDETIAQLSDAVGAMDGVVQVDQPFVNDAGDTAVITVIPATSANDNATQDLVTDLRDSTIPAALEGSTAQLTSVDRREASWTSSTTCRHAHHMSSW